MLLQLSPILASLKRHKLTTTILVAQVALTFAIICNVAFMISSRAKQVMIPTGLNERTLMVVHVTDLSKGQNTRAKHEADLANLSRIKGVQAVAAVDALPLNAFDINLVICTTPQALGRVESEETYAGNHCAATSVFDGTQGALSTLGLNLVAGRDFLREELIEVGPMQVLPDAHSAILPVAFAAKIFNGENALGRNLYIGIPGRPEPLELRVVGLVKHLLRPQLRDASTNEDTMLISGLPGGSTVNYVLKSREEDRATIGRAAVEALLHGDPNRLIPPESVESYSELRDRYFQRDMTMIKLLAAAGSALFIVTAIGIAGLANFWVQQRKRSIGIRRALGGKRSEILQYFLLENGVIVTGGVLLGALSAWFFNVQLMRLFEFASLPVEYYFIAGILLLFMGQIAALGPALRAAKVPPIVATR